MNKNTILKRINSKISGNAGETIGETLVSLLIASLALVVLAGAISAASGIIMRSRDRINTYYDNAEYVVKMPDSIPSGESGEDITINKGTATVTITAPGPQTVLSTDVTYYENTEFGRTPVVSYKK